MITWSLKKFGDLTPHELYAVLRLRTEVFVVEQACVFQDMDNKDLHCHHLMGWETMAEGGPVLIACARLVPPGISYDFPSIGRIASSPSVRGRGIGKLLMDRSLEETRLLYKGVPVRIGAQLYLKKFYESFGFQQSSERYDEDGIDHIEMTCT